MHEIVYLLYKDQMFTCKPTPPMVNDMERKLHGRCYYGYKERVQDVLIMVYQPRGREISCLFFRTQIDLELRLSVELEIIYEHYKRLGIYLKNKE